MVTGCTLNFLVPQADAYVAALRKSAPRGPVLLIGTGKLADRIAATKAAQRSKLQHITDFPTTIPTHCVLILTETDEERLANQLLACIDCTDLTILAPITARHFSRKPLFIVSIPKGGTHLVYELAKAMGYATGVELPDFPKPQTWYCLEYSNSHTVAKDFFVDTVRRSPFGNRHHPFPHSPVLFCYRHPLDILVSEAHYYCRDGKTVFSGYFSEDDLNQRIQGLAHDKWLLGPLRERVGGFLPWLRFPNVIPVSFEELVGEKGGGIEALQRQLIWSILLKLQVDGSVAEISGRVFNTHSATFHEGRIGAFRKQLSAGLIEDLAQDCHELMEGFGYDTHTEPPVSRHAPQFRRRPLRYSTQDFDAMALGIETDFLGCNLVRFSGRFYAAPISAGPLDFTTLTAGQLARLPSASSLADLKTLLTVGQRTYAIHREQLDRAGATLQHSEEPPESYWNDSGAAPRIIQEYQGYNFILWQGRYLAIPQAIGKVDLPKDLSTLRTETGGLGILVAADADSLIPLVDTTVLEARLNADITSVRTLLGGLEANTHKLEQDCSSIREAQSDILHHTQQSVRTLAEEERNARTELGLQIRLHVLQIAEQTQTAISQSQKVSEEVLRQHIEENVSILNRNAQAARTELQYWAENALQRHDQELQTIHTTLGLHADESAGRIEQLKTQIEGLRATLTRQVTETETRLTARFRADIAETGQKFQSAIATLALQHEERHAALQSQIQALRSDNETQLKELRTINESLHTRIGALEGNRVIVLANHLSRLYRRIFRK